MCYLIPHGSLLDLLWKEARRKERVKGVAPVAQGSVPSWSHGTSGLVLVTAFCHLYYFVRVWMYGIMFLYRHGIKPEGLKLWLCGREQFIYGKEQERCGAWLVTGTQSRKEYWFKKGRGLELPGLIQTISSCLKHMRDCLVRCCSPVSQTLAAPTQYTTWENLCCVLLCDHPAC